MNIFLQSSASRCKIHAVINHNLKSKVCVIIDSPQVIYSIKVFFFCKYLRNVSSSVLAHTHMFSFGPILPLCTTCSQVLGNTIPGNIKLTFMDKTSGFESNRWETDLDLKTCVHSLLYQRIRARPVSALPHAHQTDSLILHRCVYLFFHSFLYTLLVLL